MPNIPDSTPVTSPAARVRSVRQGSDTNPQATGGPPRASLREMPSDVTLRGVYVPVITPFASDGSVALDAIDRLCHEYLDAGVTGIVALGTTGESTALDVDEKRSVI